MKSVKLELKSALLDFDTDRVRKILLLQNGNIDIPKLLEEVLYDIGIEWEKGELALSHVYMSGNICEKLLNEIYIHRAPLYQQQPRLAIATFIDHHSLGKNLVLSVLRSSGFLITDLGQGISLPNLATKVEEERIEILLISVLMLSSALKIKELHQELVHRNYHVKLLVGGAPFNFDKFLWQDIGADAMGCSPSEALTILKDWIN